MGERQRIAIPEEMATTSTAVATVPPQTQEQERVAVITLRPTRTETRKKVVWTEDTIDNEHMNKKKSKCCCIYEKPRKFGESDSEDSDDEIDHCFGHVEKKRGKHHHHQHQHDCPLHAQEAGASAVTITEQQTTPPVQPTATLTFHSSEAAPKPSETAPKPSETASKASEAAPLPAPAPPDKKKKNE